ncbi:MAG: dihydrofolate reductase family protein [Nitrosopumilus sp.]|nr:dihydrofolate reductase family protein [Nitrosopumilus sp.]MDH3515333.1 dihydrofolate reductase family protein [Nitrosopumilus sp.]MDH3564365.1 dihydrofolate reductase family protein [Nitrosopumilus sp.]MDH5418299.1 dihydrofolate reductase family protein [Nitrosopumilus sp.]MDH5554963.1 dihydrofolate reductase family protein [Nitrosopumilus sp.]
MTKVLVYIASSLDGYIARENGAIDWLPETAESGYDAFYNSIDTVIMGKTTYDQILTFGEYPYKDKKSFVFTRSTQNKEENIEFVSDVEKFVKDGFPGAGENIWLVGGAKIIASFLNQGAVDEIIISVIPILLGKGIHLFKNIENETKLELVKTVKYEKLADLHYNVLK